MMHPSGSKQTAPQTLRFIRCASNTAEYCLEMAAVHSVGRLQQFDFQPTWEGMEKPAGALGWITAQQKKVPVFDLAKQLYPASAVTAQASQEGFVLLVNAAELFGLRVERIMGNLEIEPTQIVALPYLIDAGTDQRFKGIIKLEDKWLLYADAAKLRRPQAPPMPSPSAPTARLTVPTGAPTQATTTPQIILFSAAQKLAANSESQPTIFGLSLTQVQEVAPLLPILLVPNAPNYVFGITNWRDVPLPIIDLSTRLGLSQEPVSAEQIDPKSRLLIARAPAGWVGIPIHPQVKAFPLPIPYQRLQQPLTVEQEFVLGVFDLEGSPLIIPDLAAMLTRNFAPQRCN